ncbi:hypothetical protein [Aquimarina longa]|uniref:hypothetical protein n=1 Tax=Aquimarina longa TaxID=1080221 RepID=UPI0011E053D7|nr:hypothetical protein [Aquimarina longa]
MKIYILFIIILSSFLLSCNNTSKTGNYTLQKITDYRNKDNPEYLLYEQKEEDSLFTFHTKKGIDYGVLEKYSDSADASDYYIFKKPKFKKPKQLENTFILNSKDALFTKKKSEIEPEYSEWSYIKSLLKNYIIFGFKEGGNGGSYVIINIKNQTVSNFETVSETFEVSEDEKFLIGWKYSKKKVDLYTICPELLDFVPNYVLGEEFKYNLETREEIITGKLGCQFVQ